MRHLLRGLPLVALGGWLIAGRFGAAPTQVLDDSDATADLASEDVLLDLRDDADPGAIRELAEKYGLALRPNSFLEPVDHLLRTRADASVIAQLAKEPLVEAVEPDLEYRLFDGEEIAANGPNPGEPPDQARDSFPNDPKYGYQWHLDQIHSPAAWKMSRGEGVTVAVIDTGVAYEKYGGFKRASDLGKTEMVAGYNFVADNAHANDDHGHGTHVAGTIAQSTDNAVGVAGVAYKARIMPLKVLSASGSGTVADIAEAIRFAADNGAQVINMSLGGRMSSKVMEKAVAYAIKKGVTVVCAAGNEGRTGVGYPAGYKDVIAVAATQFDESLTFYSNKGSRITLSAPGGNVRVDQNGDGFPDGVLQNTILPGAPDQDGYLFYMGTSMASPHVAGVAALVVASGVTEPEAVKKVLVETSRKPKVDCQGACGAGIVDAAAAIAKTKVTYPATRFALSGALLLALAGAGFTLRRRGLSLLLGLGLGSVALPFATTFLGGHLDLLSTSSWAMGLNPLVYSALPSFLAVGLAFGFRRARPAIAGFCVGSTAALLFFALSGTTRVALLAVVPGASMVWLLANALATALLARLTLRTTSSSS